MNKQLIPSQERGSIRGWHGVDLTRPADPVISGFHMGFPTFSGCFRVMILWDNGSLGRVVWGFSLPCHQEVIQLDKCLAGLARLFLWAMRRVSLREIPALKSGSCSAAPAGGKAQSHLMDLLHLYPSQCLAMGRDSPCLRRPWAPARAKQDLNLLLSSMRGCCRWRCWHRSVSPVISPAPFAF